MKKRGWIRGIFQMGSWKDVRTDWMCFSIKKKRGVVDDAKVFDLCNLGNSGIIHRAGKSWTWCRSVGGAVGGDLKLTVSHSRKGVKKQLDT